MVQPEAQNNHFVQPYSPVYERYLHLLVCVGNVGVRFTVQMNLRSRKLRFVAGMHLAWVCLFTSECVTACI